jgi:multiple sugar transport system substrate-binding protein
LFSEIPKRHIFFAFYILYPETIIKICKTLQKNCIYFYLDLDLNRDYQFISKGEIMNKTLLKIIIACSMLAVCGGFVLAGGQADQKKGNYDLTLLSVDTTNPNFAKWKADAEAATGLKINIIATPTDADTRQQKITTILSSGDTSIDILEVNDEMLTAFKNTGWLEPIQDKVITPEIMAQLPQAFVKDMMTSRNGDIVGIH